MCKVNSGSTRCKELFGGTKHCVNGMHGTIWVRYAKCKTFEAQLDMWSNLGVGVEGELLHDV